MPSDRDDEIPDQPPFDVPPFDNGGAEASPPAPGSVEALRAELTAKTEEAARNHDRYLRERAELENVKKRLQREKTDAIRFANESLLRDLLPVLDN